MKQWSSTTGYHEIFRQIPEKNCGEGKVCVYHCSHTSTSTEIINPALYKELIIELYWSIVLERLRTIPLFILKGNRVVPIRLEDIPSQHQIATAETFTVIHKEM